MSAFSQSLRKISIFIAIKTQYLGVMQTFRAQCIATLRNLIEIQNQLQPLRNRPQCLRKLFSNLRNTLK